MRKTFRLILAAALCGLAFTSCSQDLQVDDPVLSLAKGTRVINATFASATKTVLGEDGLTPYFENGDQIAVSNSEDSEICTVTVSGDNAWFSTNLEGELNALYPASVGLFNEGGVLIGQMIPDNQSGLFKDANIAWATISLGSTTATFENETALLKVIPPEGTKQLTIAYTGDFEYEGEVYLGKEMITVGNGTDALGTYYVALSPEKNAELSFDTGLETKCIPSGTIKDDELLAGWMYTIDETGWTPNDLPGKFSVSEGKQVQFSKGNLQATYDGGKYTWGFAANQYDCVGNAVGNTSIDTQSIGDVVDLFGWSTSNTNYGISTSIEYGDYSGDFVDWGKNIGDGNTWRTLSKGEWVYLFETRTNASSLYKCGVTVLDIDNCLIIAPDGWDTSANPLQLSYDASDWPAAEAAGLVCLPAAGYRSGSNVSTVGEWGYYWSSSVNDNISAFEMEFYFGEDFFPAVSSSRFYGDSVRLIKDCE